MEDTTADKNTQTITEKPEDNGNPLVSDPPVVSPARSALRSTGTRFRNYAERSRRASDNPNPVLPRWQTRRFAVAFDIKKPKDRSKRTEYLSAEINKLLTTIGQFNKVFVRKFASHSTVHDSEKYEWKKELNKEMVSDLQTYTHGFYFYGNLRDGNFRLLIQLVLPITCNIEDLIMNVNGNKWASRNNRSFRDIKEQSLYDPKFCGWLFRSNYSMVASSELQRILESRAAQLGTQVSFGVSFKMIPGSMVQGESYDKDKAIKAVCIMTNAEDQHVAWDLLYKWYNKQSASYPMSIPMKFIPSKDHPDIRNNSVAIQNLSHLFDRQKVFLRDTATMECSSLADPAARTPEGKTLRNVLKNVKATVSGENLNGGNLFHAITSKTTQAGELTYHITYHRCLEKEARNVIGGLPQFPETELKLDPEDFCHPHLVDNTHIWDPSRRCIENKTTEYLAELVGDISVGEDSEAEEEEYSMDSKAYRESRRVLGLEDSETIGDMKKKKKKKPKKKVIPAQVSEAQSVNSEITGLTPYTSASKASQQRKELRNQVKDQEIELAKYKAMIKEFQRKANGTSEQEVVNIDIAKPGEKNKSREEEDSSLEEMPTRRETTHGGTYDLSQDRESEEDENELENVARIEHESQSIDSEDRPPRRETSYGGTVDLSKGDESEDKDSEMKR